MSSQAPRGAIGMDGGVAAPQVFAATSGITFDMAPPAPLGFASNTIAGALQPYVRPSANSDNEMGTGNLWDRDHHSSTKAGYTSGFVTSEVAAYTKLCSPLPADLERFTRGSKMYQCIIGRRDNASQLDKLTGLPTPRMTGGVATYFDARRNRGPHEAGPGMSGRRHTMFGIPAFNFLAAQDKYANPPLTPDEVKSADEVWEKWRFEGVVTTEFGGENAPGIVMPNQGPHERGFNFRYIGQVKTFNLWGAGLKNNTRLFFLLGQWDPSPSGDGGLIPDFVLGNTGDATRPIWAPQGSTTAEFARDALHNPIGVTGYAYKDAEGITRYAKPMQLKAFARNFCTYPSLKDRAYTDEFGVLRYARVIYLGRIQHASDATIISQEMLDAAMHDEQMMLRLPDMWIYVLPRKTH